MNEPKGEPLAQEDRPEQTVGGTAPSGGRQDENVGGTDNTTANTVAEAKEAAEEKRRRG
jgi:hypothetical protein